MPWKQGLLFDRAAPAGISQLRRVFVLQGEAGALPVWHGGGGMGKCTLSET